MSAITNFFDDDYLWSYTKRYYFFTFAVFLMVRKRYGLHPLTIIPCMSIPMLADQVKREFYLFLFKDDKK